MKVLLTSAGFENRNIAHRFLGLISKEPAEAKIVFVPTAAINPDAIAVLPKCMNDLLGVGIKPENILVYDLHCKMKYKELKKYDAIYFCGGNTEYLTKRIVESKFKKELQEYINKNGVYVGVSAGSYIATANIENGLGLIKCRIQVHCNNGDSPGMINDIELSVISLTDKQAILITNSEKEIIE